MTGDLQPRSTRFMLRGIDMCRDVKAAFLGMFLLALSCFIGGMNKAFAAQHDVSAPSVRLTPGEKSRLSTERLVAVSDVAAFPDTCKNAFSTLTREPRFSLANPTQPFQATDVIAAGPRLPWRRLILGGISADRCVIYYEKGGIAASRAAVVIDASTPAVIWGGVGGTDARDLKQLVERIAEGAFKPGDRYSW